VANDLEQLSNSLGLMKKLAPNGEDYWMGRDLQVALGYTNWVNFEKVIQKGVQACEGTGIDPTYHFVESSKMIEVGKGAKVKAADWFLTRYACYLIAMNGDSTKAEIATAQSYFAVQTRRQEITDAATAQLDADGARIKLRERVSGHYKDLAGVAMSAGVTRFGLFEDAGYRGLYDMGIADLKRLKGIPKKDSVLDVAGREELASHEFRLAQTRATLTRENIRGERLATDAHLQVGREVRNAIKRMHGTMPEKLPKEPHIKTLISAQKKAAKLAGARPKELGEG
jgi:DNA-damage-inducible protein D